MTQVGLPSTSSRTAVEPRHRPVLTLLITALFLTTGLSGCISLDFFLPQKANQEQVPEGTGLVRLWVTVQPGAIGAEFVRYNVTFGPAYHLQDAFAERLVLMNSTRPTVDLVALEAKKKAAALGGLIVQPGTYHGYGFQTTNASLTRSEVVGNDDGQEVVRYIDQEIEDVNSKTAHVMFTHHVYPNSITDIFLELDMRRSLNYEKGTFSHATVLVGTSVYLDGSKMADDRNRQLRGNAPVSARVSPDGAHEDRFDNMAAPVTRYEMHEATHGGKLFDSNHPSRIYNKAVGLGQDLKFSSRSYSSILYQGERGRINEFLWNFGDGTTAAGGTITHNWTAGGIYDVSLSVRDEYGLVGRTHGSFIVPYRPDEAVERQKDARADQILLGNSAPGSIDASKASETFAFPDDLHNGDLRLGGYRLTLRFSEPTGGLGAGTLMRMHADSGRFQAVVNGTSPLVIETAGMSVYVPGPAPWVAEDLQVDLELLTGAHVSYELTVEALYFENMTRGYDSHATHRHGTWPAGPDLRTIHWNGTAIPPTKED